MTKRSRKILFFICLFLFLVAAPAIILYCQGYRIDFNPGSAGKILTQTGGLSLKAEPKQGNVYLDGKLAKKTDFFFGSALIENLLPKKYKITLIKDGYSPWEKNLEIKEKEVTKAENIVLFRENPELNVLIKENIQNFWFSPDGKKIILKETEGKSWALKIYDLEKKIKSYLINGEEIYSKGSDLINLEWTNDSKEIYLDIGLKEREGYFSLKVGEPSPKLKQIIIQGLPDNTLVSQTIDNNTYYLDNLGYFFKNNEKIIGKPFPIQQETEYVIKVFQDYIFLKEEKTLYLYNLNSRSFEKLFDGVNDLKISPDNKKMAYFSNSEIWVLFLSDKPDQPTKKAGEKLFLVRLSETISDVFWLNSDYLIFNGENKIKIIETDDRDKVQIWQIGEVPNPKIYFNQTDKKLYFLSEQNLYSSDPLLK